MIERLGAPAMVTWQLTRDCNLACVHCCTDSAPGKALTDELNAEEAMRLARDIVKNEVPKVMLAGGEPTMVPHFLEIAEYLGKNGVALKIETNGKNFGPDMIARLKPLPIFSIQISLDGDTPEAYRKQRPGGELEQAHRACREVVAAGLPLEITFAPTRMNIHQAEAVIDRAASFSAFRFNSGLLMRVGTAARLWDRIEPSRAQYAAFLRLLRRKERELRGKMELCYKPWSLTRELQVMFNHPPATVLVLPDGKMKVCAPLPHLCADLRQDDLAGAWRKYKSAWTDPRIKRAVFETVEDSSLLSRSNNWVMLRNDSPAVPAAAGGSAR